MWSAGDVIALTTVSGLCKDLCFLPLLQTSVHHVTSSGSGHTYMVFHVQRPCGSWATLPLEQDILACTISPKRKCTYELNARCNRCL